MVGRGKEGGGGDTLRQVYKGFEGKTERGRNKAEVRGRGEYSYFACLSSSIITLWEDLIENVHTFFILKVKKPGNPPGEVFRPLFLMWGDSSAGPTVSIL